ncbi:MAG: acyl-CoA synthetase (AMP-forming)/AMP-acid ligase II [Hyphomicrobiaceae bacterium]|jgi:acyl-CoA synthetase (AMP-forming)/AMP-acid ligase II
MNVASFLVEQARKQPFAVAVYYPDGRNRDGKTRYTHYTYRQLDLESDRIARGLKAMGIERGVRTALLVRPSLEFFALTLAVFRIGAVPIVVDPGIGLSSLKACLDEAEPEAFIGVPAAHAARVVLGWGRATIRKNVTVGRRWFWGGATLAQLREGPLASQAEPIADTNPDELAAILFTSGSTGLPKGVEYRHENFAAQVEAIRNLAVIDPGEVDLPTFPLFALFDPAFGMAAVIPDMDPTRPGDVNPLRIAEAVEDFGVTNMFGSPALLDTVSRYGAKHGLRLPTLKRVISAGAPVPAQVMRRFLEMLPEGAEILTPYGATECLPVACISSRDVLEKTAAATDAGAGVCVGRPVASVEVRIIRIDDGPIAQWNDDNVLANGEVGEITVRGPQATRAYYNRPEATALAKIAGNDGTFWHRMGDVGYFDDDGLLWFCGRKAHRVRTTEGVRFTIPCEAVFNTHEAVRRTALVGVGGTPVLCVEKLADARPIANAKLIEELLELGAGYEHTRCIETVLFHPGFPVDIRHNAKIGREKLAVWASKRVKSSKA